MKDVEQDLIATALPYWETEATIVRRFFKSKPTREDHIFWLKAQLWKELHPVDGYFTGLQKELNNLVASFPEIDKTIGRHQYHALLEQLTQEFNHYVLMADTCSWLTFSNIFWAMRFAPRIRFNSPRRKNSEICAELTRTRDRPSIGPPCSSPKAAARECFAKEES